MNVPAPVPLAVVVPVWNRDRLIVRCLDSVLAQTHAAAKIVVVDDGSTDGTAEAVAEWIREHGAATGAMLLRQPNLGAAKARNAGFAATGNLPFVAFLDSDDVWPPDFLARTVAALSVRPDAVAASVDCMRHDLRKDTRRIDALGQLALDPVKWIFQHGAALGSGTVFRAAAVRAAGGFPDAYPTGHDIVLLCRVARIGTWLHCSGEPVTFFRNHADDAQQATHLCERYPDHKLIWARAYEEIAREIGPSRLHARWLRRALGRRWARAGIAMQQFGQYRKASACFARSIRWRPLRPRAWSKLLRASFLAVVAP